MYRGGGVGVHGRVLHRPETKGARMCGRGKCDGVSEVYRGYARERRSQARRSRSWRAKQKKQGKASTLGGNQPNHTSCTLLPTATVTCRHLSLAIASSSPASCRRAHLPLFPHYFDAFLLQDCGACENRTDRDEARPPPCRTLGRVRMARALSLTVR